MKIAERRNYISFWHIRRPNRPCYRHILSRSERRRCIHERREKKNDSQNRKACHKIAILPSTHFCLPSNHEIKSPASQRGPLVCTDLFPPKLNLLDVDCQGNAERKPPPATCTSATLSFRTALAVRNLLSRRLFCGVRWEPEISIFRTPPSTRVLGSSRSNLVPYYSPRYLEGPDSCRSTRSTCPSQAVAAQPNTVS